MLQRHRFDPISFVFGLGFIALALLFTVPADPWAIYFGDMTLGWVWPLFIIGAGIALLAPVIRGGLNPDADEPTPEHTIE